MSTSRTIVPDKERGDLSIVHETRVTTDIFFLLIFGGSVIFTFVVFIFALVQGQKNIDILKYPPDYEGKICSPGSSTPYIYYPYTIQEMASVSNRINSGLMSISDIDYYGICVSSCPKAQELVCNYDTDIDFLIESQINYTYFYLSCGADYDDICRNCSFSPFNTYPLVGRCVPQSSEISAIEESCAIEDFFPTIQPISIPTKMNVNCLIKRKDTHTSSFESNDIEPIKSKLKGSEKRLELWLHDIYVTKWVVLCCSFAVPFVLGFIIYFLLSSISNLALSVYIFFMFCCTLSMTVLFYYYGNLLPNKVVDRVISIVNYDEYQRYNTSFNMMNTTDLYNLTSITNYTLPYEIIENTSQYFEVSAYVFTGITILLFIILIIICEEVENNSSLINELYSCFSQFSSAKLLPVFMLAINVLLYILFIYTGISIYTSFPNKYVVNMERDANFIDLYCNQIPVDECFPSQIGTSLGKSGKILIWFIFVFYLWFQEIAYGLFVASIGGLIGSWYFTKKDDAHNKILDPNLSIFTMFKNIFFFNIGSLAFGGIILPISKSIRGIILYVQEKSIQGSNRSVFNVFNACLQLCSLCANNIIKKLTRQSYIIISTRGYTFMSSANHAYFLVQSQFNLFSNLNTFIPLMVIISKLGIASLSTIIGMMWIIESSVFTNGNIIDLYNYYVPIILIFFISYVLTSYLVDIYGVVLDTIFLCYCEDYEKWKENSPYASSEIRGIMEPKKDRAETKKQQ